MRDWTKLSLTTRINSDKNQLQALLSKPKIFGFFVATVERFKAYSVMTQVNKLGLPFDLSYYELQGSEIGWRNLT
jgi:hypothetical protein